jgi:hypothetical protein
MSIKPNRINHFERYLPSGDTRLLFCPGLYCPFDDFLFGFILAQLLGRVLPQQ